MDIRGKAKTEEIDYLFLMERLSSYKRPRDKLTSLLKQGHLIRVKKGLYVFGKEHRKRPYSLEVLSNLIYGPSYVSFEYALAYYDLLPERVTRVTCASYKRSKHFTTPVGEFIYHYLSPKKFSVGTTWETIDEHTHFLIATREKALADYLARLKSFSTCEDLLAYLVDGMRIADLSALRLTLLKEIAQTYKNTNVTLLCHALKK